MNSIETNETPEGVIALSISATNVVIRPAIVVEFLHENTCSWLLLDCNDSAAGVTTTTASAILWRARIHDVKKRQRLTACGIARNRETRKHLNRHYQKRFNKFQSHKERDLNDANISLIG
ncbi:hypothetical protein G3N95_17145 [Paraburkholderia sp. Tr-20389]|uniref:hypothetical protein n=1 Tax=Paraburkholderia sp. Tr-20389 TaxID=2703903 RepID=UPI00197D3ACF|nr:hypothetical protein [Paraburkholderia sp. Tr-20389]MBN3754681.1 hypothetical protein [Paraburkholderia sp. Tr-20389]